MDQKETTELIERYTRARDEFDAALDLFMDGIIDRVMSISRAGKEVERRFRVQYSDYPIYAIEEIYIEGENLIIKSLDNNGDGRWCSFPVRWLWEDNYADQIYNQIKSTQEKQEKEAAAEREKLERAEYERLKGKYER